MPRRRSPRSHLSLLSSTLGFAAALALGAAACNAQALQQSPPLVPSHPAAPAPGASTAKPPVVTPPAAIKAAHLFEMAVGHQRSGKIDAAIAEYRQLVKLAPGAFPAWFNLGLIYYGRGSMADAASCFREAAKLEPKNALPPTQLARVYLAERKLPQAVAEAARACSVDPANAQAHYALGNCYGAEKRFADAEAQFRIAAKLSPHNALVWFDLASVLGDQKRYAEALQAFRKATEIDPQNGQAWLFVGVVLQDLKRYDEAIPAYHRAAALIKEPNSAAAWFNIGACYELRGVRHSSRAGELGGTTRADAQQALSAYLEAVRIAPKYLPAQVGAGRLYFGIGNYGEAVRYFSAASALNPSDARLLGNTAIAETYAAAAEPDLKRRQQLQASAGARLQRAIARDPLPMLYSAEANLFRQENKPERVEAAYSEWSARRPKDPEPLVRLAQLREGQNKRDEALEYYRRAAALDPKSAEPHLGMARIYETATPPQTDRAAVELRLAVQADPKSVDAHRQLGQLLLTQPGHAGEALAEFDAVKRLAPQDSSAYVALATTYEREKQYDLALKEYRAMCAANPKDAAGHWYAARILEQEKRYDEAIAEYREIEKLQPNDTGMVANIGRLLELAGKTDAAVAEYRRLLDKNRGSLQYHLMYAHGLESLGKHDEAIAEYRAILAQFPASTDAWLQIGDIYRDQKRYDDARAAYAHVLDRADEVPGAYDRLAAVYEAEKKKAGWVGFLKDRIAAHPDDRTAITRLELASSGAAGQADTLEFLKATSQKSPNSAPFLRGYADVLDHWGRHDEALTVYRQLAKLVPNDWMVHENLAREFETLGRIPDAIGAYEQLLGIGSVPPIQASEARMKLAALFEKNGQRAEALAQYRETLKSEPGNSAAAAAIKRLGG